MYENTILAEIKQQHQEKKQTGERVFNFLYGCAMVDAILRAAFKGKKKWIYDVREAKECVKAYVNKLFAQDSFKSQEEHDALFLELAHKICDAINQNTDREDTFTFGNAQKLLNMTAKHCFIYMYMNPSLRENFKFCHCPMDGIMLKAVWDQYKKIEKTNDKGRNSVLGGSGEFVKAWGTEDFENDTFPQRYKNFQKTISKWAEEVGCIPLELDFYLWDFKQEETE